jgi:hypothetical protein
MKILKELSYTEQQEIAAMQAAFEKAGCVFEFAVFRVAGTFEDQAALHKEALDRLDVQVNQKAALEYERLITMHPKREATPFVGCKFKTELATPIAVKPELVHALLETKSWSSDKHFYAAFFQSFDDPPYGTNWDHVQAPEVFQRWTEMIGLIPADQPQLMDWVSNPNRIALKGYYPDEPERCSWSNYFDDGLEWWGIWCFTIWNPRKQTMAALMASATD